MTRFGYVRVSSFDQSNTGLSIQVQRDSLKAIGILDEHIFCDSGRSGGIHEDSIERKHEGRYFLIKIDLYNRPELYKLMGLLKANDEIYFSKYDRLSRSIHFMEEFCDWCKEKQVKLISLTESPDPLIRKIITVFSEEELHKTVIRNASVFKGIFDKGLFPYKPPTGYVKNVKLDNGNLKYSDHPEGALIIDPDKIDFVKDVFKMMGEGIHYKKVCEKYGISNRTIYDILRNKTYLGFTHYENDWKPSPFVPQIVSQEVWDRANAHIKTREFDENRRLIKK